MYLITSATTSAASALEFEESQHKSHPEGIDTASFLMQIGKDYPNISSSSSFEVDEIPEADETPEPPKTHPTVIVGVNDKGIKCYELREKTPLCPAKEEDEICAFRLDYAMERYPISCMNRHDERGWLLWKFSADPKNPKQKDVLFTLGGVKTLKGNEPVDPETNLIICSGVIHADIASGRMGHWVSAPEYGYEMPELSGEEESEPEEASDTAEAVNTEETSETEEAAAVLVSLDEALRAAPHRVQQAVKLGDFEWNGNYDACGYPILRAKVNFTHDEILLTLNPHALEPMGMSNPPHVTHEPYQIHSSLMTALWGSWNYHNPRKNDLQSYVQLCQGIEVRYGDN